MKKWLVIEGSSAEKVMMATPLLRCLQKSFSGNVYFLTNKVFEKYIRNNININHLYFFSDHIKQLVADFNIQQFDGIIDLQNNEQSRLITNEVNAKLVEEKHGFFEKLSALFAKKPNPITAIFNLAKGTGVSNDGQGIGFFLDNKIFIAENDLPTSHQAGFIAVVMPATKAQEKSFDIEKIKALCQAINHPIVLLGDWEDSANASYISKSIDDIKIYNACGKFNFDETCLLIKMSKVVIAQQNALLQIACALNQKVVYLAQGKKQAIDISSFYDELFLRREKNAPFAINYTALNIDDMKAVASQVLALIK